MSFQKTRIEKEFILRSLDLLHVLKELMEQQREVPLKLVLSYNNVLECLHFMGYTTEKSFGDTESDIKRH